MIKNLSKIILSFLFISFANISVSDDVRAYEEVLGESTLFNESEMALLVAKPSVVQITNITTGELVLQSNLAYELNAPELSGKSYEFEVGFNGSGFFVTKDGYLITNGHVAKPDNDTTAYYAIVQKAEQIMKDAIKYAAISKYGYTPSNSEIEEAYQYVLSYSYNGSEEAMINDIYETDYYGGSIAIENIEYTNYIQTGVAKSTKTEVIDLGISSIIIDTVYEGNYDSTDLALLLVDGDNFPTIDLGNFDEVHIGKEVFAIGYPGIVEQATGIMTDKVSELEPSITKGIISAKRKLVDGTLAFQTDAGITHGSSGGPVVNSEGKVIGVATWSFGDTPGGESFNFLISVEQVYDVLSRNNIDPKESPTTLKWREGLELYSNKCYKDAKSKFSESKTFYSDNVDVDKFIKNSDEAIARGEDECSASLDIWMIVVSIACCAGLFFIVVIIAVIIIAKTRKKPQTNANLNS